MYYFVIDEGYCLILVCFNVFRIQVRIWVVVYDVYGEEGLKFRDKGVLIVFDIRVEVVKVVLMGQIFQMQVVVKFNVVGLVFVGKWMKVFSEYGEEGFCFFCIGKKRVFYMIDDFVVFEVVLECLKDKCIQEFE